MDERGRILIPLNERKKLGLKVGTEFELVREDGVLVLRPIIPEPCVGG
jgi:AbrB family looped-hinge helix DNA binding protein